MTTNVNEIRLRLPALVGALDDVKHAVNGLRESDRTYFEMELDRAPASAHRMLEVLAEGVESGIN